MFTVKQLELKRVTTENCNDEIALFNGLVRNSEYDHCFVERVSNVVEEFLRPFQQLVDGKYSQIS